MARAPFQVLVLPFRRMPSGFEYAIFERADLSYWQGIAGGGEEGEQPFEAARREALEEAAIPPTAPLYRLQTVNSIPVEGFAARRHWPPDLYVMPEYTFGCDATGCALVVSSEHNRFLWRPFAEASALLHWQDNRVALWELDARLRDGRLSPPS